MMTNVEWIDLLAKEWNISRSVAKEMLYQMYQVKRIDGLRKEWLSARKEWENNVHSNQEE